MNEAKLKPCPFCGGKAFNETYSVRKGFEANAHCNSCLAMVYTITYDTYEEAKKKAIESWNRRANENPIDESPILSGDEYEQMIKENNNDTHN